MNAAASLTRLEPSAASSTPTQPLVIVDGRPREDLWLTWLRCAGLLDEREATIVLRPTASPFLVDTTASVDRLVGGRVELLLPTVLIGGETTALPLMRGVIRSCARTLGANSAVIELTAVCDWSRTLDLPLTGTIGESFTTITGIVAAVNRQCGAGIDLSLLNADVRGRRLPSLDVTGKTLREVLKPLFQSQALCIRRRMQWRGTVEEQRSIASLADARPIRLPSMQTAADPSVVEALDSMARRRRPQKLIAFAAGQVVESTFELVPGWEPAKEGMSAGEYGRSTSSDFDTVANVHRLWVLNEDGAFSAAPFNRGPAFDLTALFQEGRAISPQPLQFGSTLTQDDAGRSLGVVVEVSTDSGSTWRRHGGSMRVLTSRAAIYFNDDVLPAGYLGSMRVRVTATLQSPEPLQAVRWRGNPFTGSFEEIRFNVRDCFAYRRIARTSRYAASVGSGTIKADTVDDRGRLWQWLVARSREPLEPIGQTAMSTTGVMAGLRVGDRLASVSGRRVAATPVETRAMVTSLTSIEHRWDENRSRLQWTVS